MAPRREFFKKMKLRSILIKGSLNEALTYSISHACPEIQKGVWEMSISSVTFNFESRINTVLSVSTNFVQTQDINADNEIVIAPSILSNIACAGKQGDKKVIGLKWRDFFEVTTPYNKLEVYLKDIESQKFVSGATAYVLVLFRKKA